MLWYARLWKTLYGDRMCQIRRKGEKFELAKLKFAKESCGLI